MKPILALFAAIGIAAASEAPSTAFFPPGTKVVFGLHMRSLANASIFKDASEEIRSGASSLLVETPLAGLDPAKDIDEVLLASSGEGQKAPAIVVIHGRFHVAVTPETQRYRDVPLLEDPKHPEAVLALIDESTLIAGDPVHVRSAIDRVQSGAAGILPESWVARIETLRSRYAIWGFGEGLEPAAKPGAAAAKPGDISSIDHFQFGIAFDQGLRLTAEAHLRTARDAQQMSGMLQLFQAMMQGQKKAANGTAFDLSVEKSAIKISLLVPEAELKKAMKEQKATLAKAFTSGMPMGMSSFMPAEFMPAEPKPPMIKPSEGRIYTDSSGDTVSVTLPVVKK